MAGKPMMRNGKEFQGAYGGSGYVKPNPAELRPIGSNLKVQNKAVQAKKEMNQ